MAAHIGGTYKTTKPTPVYDSSKNVIATLPKGTIVKPGVTGCFGGEPGMVGGCVGGTSFWYTDKGKIVDTQSLVEVTEQGAPTKLIGQNSVVSAGLSNKTYLYALGAILLFAYLVKSKKIKL